MVTPQQLIQRQDDAAYLLTRAGLRIVWTNEAFDRFSAANDGGTSLSRRVRGQSILSFVPRPLKRFYAELYNTVARARRPYRHDYRCSSRSQRRWFAQYILPEGSYVAILNVLAATQPHENMGFRSDWSTYVGGDGTALQCPHCRRMAEASTGVWSLFPECFEPDAGAPPTQPVLCPECEWYFTAPCLIGRASTSFLSSHLAFQPAALRTVR